MCGRYLALTEGEILEYREIINEVNERYKDMPLLGTMKSGEIAPTDVAPVLVAGKSNACAALMKWGFPKWQGSGVVINARAETALDKKMFRVPLLSRRCVIPSAGFFEWKQGDGRKKDKYLFRIPDTKRLNMAGFYDTFSGVHAYVILTTAANASMAGYHSRMPLILSPDDVDQWLCDKDFAADYVGRPCGAVLTAMRV